MGKKSYALYGNQAREPSNRTIIDRVLRPIWIPHVPAQSCYCFIIDLNHNGKESTTEMKIDNECNACLNVALGNQIMNSILRSHPSLIKIYFIHLGQLVAIGKDMANFSLTTHNR